MTAHWPFLVYSTATGGSLGMAYVALTQGFWPGVLLFGAYAVVLFVGALMFGSLDR